MKKLNKTVLTGQEEIATIYGGAYDIGGDMLYDVSYLIGYGFAWISRYIGSHASSYGVAFK